MRQTETLISLHLRSLFSAFVVRMKKLCILCYPRCAQSWLWSDRANAQAGSDSSLGAYVRTLDFCRWGLTIFYSVHEQLVWASTQRSLIVWNMSWPWLYGLFAKFHDLGSMGSWDILLSRFYYAKKSTSEKRALFNQIFIKVPAKFSQVIYTLVPNCLQNFTSLTQVVPSIFLLRNIHLLKCLSLKRDITPPWTIW